MRSKPDIDRTHLLGQSCSRPGKLLVHGRRSLYPVWRYSAYVDRCHYGTGAGERDSADGHDSSAEGG